MVNGEKPTEKLLSVSLQYYRLQNANQTGFVETLTDVHFDGENQKKKFEFNQAKLYHGLIIKHDQTIAYPSQWASVQWRYNFNYFQIDANWKLKADQIL